MHERTLILRRVIGRARGLAVVRELSGGLFALPRDVGG